MIGATRPRPVVWYLAALCLVLIVPLMAIAGWSTIRYVGAERAWLEREAHTTVAHITTAVERELARYVATLQALASSPSLERGDLAVFHRFASELAGPGGANIVLDDLDGQQLVNTRLTPGGAFPKYPLQPVHRAVIETGRPQVSDLIRGPETGRFLVVVSVPVRRDGEVTHLLSMAVPATSLSDLVAREAPPEPSFTGIADRAGIILARSTEAATYVGRPAPNLELSREPSGTWRGTNVAGVPVFSAYQRSSFTGWIFVTGVSQATLEAPLRRSLWLLAGTGAAIIGLASLAGLAIARYVTRSAQGVVALARDLGAGRAVEARPLPVREAMVLGEALAAASAGLRERDAALEAGREELAQANAELEHRVEVRTRELSESEARYRLLADHATDMVVQADLDTTRRYVSPASRELLGYAPEELVGMRPVDFVHPDDADAYRAVLARVAEGGGDPVVTEQRYRRRDGSYVWTEVRFRLVRDAAGEPSGYVASLRDISERKEAEAALRDSEARYRLLADALPQKVWVADRDGRASYYNRQVVEDHGPVGPLLADRVALTHPEDSGRIERLLHKAIREGEAVEDEARLRRRDGAWRWHKITVIPIRRDEAGAVTEWLGTSLDIHDLVTARQALQDTADLLRLAQDSAGAGLFDWDLVEARARLSPESLHLFGLPGGSGAEVDAGRCLDALHPDDIPGVLAEVERAAATGAPYRAEFRILRDDEPDRWVQAVGRVETGEDGRAARVVGLNFDVTERRQAEARLQESEARYRLLAENTSDIIVLGHAGGRRSYVSPAVLPVLGYTQDEVASLSLRELIHPDDVEPVFAAIGGLHPERPYASATYRARHRNGHWVWIEGAFRLSDAGEELTVVSSLRDVTARQQAAEELRAARDEAERARGEAEAAARAKSDFLATMSHEIRTPLNGIIGFAGLILDRADLAPDLRRQVGLVLTAGSSLLTVVNDVLDLSKIEAGGISLDPRPFPTESLVENTASIVRGTAEAKGLAFTVEVDGDVPAWLVGDESRLRQVLLNYLNNAVKFTREGHVALRVTREGEDESGIRLRFAVTDTGIGISPEGQDRLFRRFSQMDGSISREFGGTGLGLAICKHLAELMGGTVGVESRPGRGSTFWCRVTLPRGTPALPLAEGEGLSLAPRASSGRILVVDDTPMNQEIARALLEQAGYEVDVVGDGPSAIRALEAGTYGLVLMDVQMPGMTGVEAAERIRALPEPSRATPIVAMTANVLPEQVAAYRQAGMVDHVGKPIDRGQLFAAVKRWIAAPPGHDEQRVTLPGGDPGLPFFDEVVHDQLVDLLGRERVGLYLAVMRRELAGGFDADPTSPEHVEQLRVEAHTMLSQAGMMGFAQLSSACKRLDEGCLRGGDVAAALARVRALRPAVIAQVDTLLCRETAMGPAADQQAAVIR